MTIKVGERLPNVTVRQVTADGPKPIETKDYFAGRTVVLFGLPGAFTPTCHKNHLPGFIVERSRIQGKGRRQNRHDLGQRPSCAVGLVRGDRRQGPYRFPRRRQRRFRQSARPRSRSSAGGLGLRSKRYSMLVVDGVVKELNIEPEPGKADVSGAQHLLGQMR